MHPVAFIGLAFMAMGGNLRAGPGLPLPPLPESVPVLWHQHFDEAYTYRSPATPLALPELGILNPSWSGYALERSGHWEAPLIAPGVEGTNGHRVSAAFGAVRFWFTPAWASVNAGGTGPGKLARLAVLNAGDQPAAVWSLQLTPDGSRLSLSGESAGGQTELLAAPVAWLARVPHLICLNYGPEATALFVDGRLAAGGPGTLPIPQTVARLVVGSTITGTETANGEFDEVATLSRPVDARDLSWYYRVTRQWAMQSLQVATSDTLSRESGEVVSLESQVLSGVPMPPYDPGEDPPPDPGVPYYPPRFLTASELCLLPPELAGANVYLRSTNSQSGVVYDVYGTTNLSPHVPGLNLTNWVWLGRGMPGQNEFSVAKIGVTEGYYRLGLPTDTDGDGLPDAYEQLVGHTSPVTFTLWPADGYGTPGAWYVRHRMDPLFAGIGALDTDGDGLANHEEYLLGSDPQTSEGFGVWLATPGGVGGLP